MPNHAHAFPWGIYIGDFISPDDDTLPVLLPSQKGGFCVLFDENSESIANNFIENVALKLFEVVPVGELSVHVFDFTHKKRFMHLSALQTESLYSIVLNANDASTKFNELEKTSQYRHHNLLTHKASTLSQYNQQNTVREKYHVLLIHLEHYPDDLASYKRIKAFFTEAFDAGFYCIAFADIDILKNENKPTQYLLKRFPPLEIRNKKLLLTNELFEFSTALSNYHFDYVNDNKDAIIETLQNQLRQTEHDDEQDFLQLPIGKTADGRKDLFFSLGDKSKNYHAFITGVAGSGKSTLLNNLILAIAEKYTPAQIRLYLMDYKEGVEFKDFDQHPHCEKIFLDNKDLNASITLLEEFNSTIEARGQTFKAHGVKDMTAYNANSAHPLPRLLLIIDEVHRLFAGSYSQKERFSQLLKDVVRRGRAFGVHIILATQTLTGTEIDKELMSQITLRASFKLTSERDSELIFDYSNTAAVGLANYMLIYNADSGNKSANILCRALPPQDIKTIIQECRKRHAQQALTPIIVTSDKQPDNLPSHNTLKERSAYSNDEDTALLNALIQTGAIQAPTGFEPLTKGDE
ncbi:MAG: FtsK/SpoIIIE domain-containing protein [Methylococcales bacterium]